MHIHMCGDLVYTLFDILTFTSALFSVAAVAITSSVVTIVSAAVGILVAPTTMVQRFELNRTGTFREVHNRLRQDVNNLAEQNEELTTEVQDLESKTQRLGGVETELQKHLKRTKHTVNSFVNLVNESEEIEKEMERIQQGDVLRHLFEAIIESDKSEDFEIEENEINRLVFKLKAVEGLNLSADAIKKCLQEMGDDRNVQDIFLAVKKLMNVEKLRIEHDQTEKDEEEQKRLKNMKIEVSTRSVV